MKEYGKCPVCETRIIIGKKCSTCGYIESLDYSLYKTLGLIDEEKSTVGKYKEWKKRNDEDKERTHQEEIEALQKCIEEMKRDRQLEKQGQEAVRKAEAEREAERIRKEAEEKERERMRQEAERKAEAERERARQEEKRKAEAEAERVRQEEKRKAEEERKRALQEAEAKRKTEAERVRQETDAEKKKPNINISKTTVVAVCAAVLVCVGIGLLLNSGGSEKNTTENTNTESSIVENSSTQDTKVATKSDDNSSSDLEVGDTIKFGTYEQDGDTSEKEDIEWTVLDKENGKLLLVSKYNLDCQPYNEEYTDATWDTCTLRSWLNDDFLNNAFSSEEQSQIEETEGLNGDNPYFEDVDGGKDTTDKIFLLSVAEAEKYFDLDDERECKATQYAKDQGVYVAGTTDNSWWWLRSAGSGGGCAACGDLGGYDISDIDYDFSGRIGVRPALWLDPES